jgi:protein subunit release factor A
MKQNKTFCFDYDLIEKLKQEDNASELISNLLYRHYASVNPDEREEQLKQEMAKFERAKNEYEKLQKAKQEIDSNKKTEQKQKDEWAKKNEEYQKKMKKWAIEQGLI